MTRKLTFEEISNYRPDVSERRKKIPVCALIENIRSLYNVGSMFRTADAAGIERLYLTGYTGYPPRKEIEKTALGSTETVPWSRCVDPLDQAQYLKRAGYTLIAFEHTDTAVDYRTVAYNRPVCLLFGNEVEGLSEELCTMADACVLIPMYGMKQSLNVSVAFGIALYHAVNEYRDTAGNNHVSGSIGN